MTRSFEIYRGLLVFTDDEIKVAMMKRICGSEGREEKCM
jgi:hypothetical protein